MRIDIQLLNRSATTYLCESNLALQRPAEPPTHLGHVFARFFIKKKRPSGIWTITDAVLMVSEQYVLASL